MTLSSEQYLSEQTGDGSTLVFSIPLKIQSSADVEVTLYDNTTKAQTLLALGSGYSVLGITATGFSLVMSTAPTASEKVVVVRRPAATQTTDIQNNGPFYRRAHENALDRQAMVSQGLRETVSRGIRVPLSLRSIAPEMAPIIDPAGRLVKVKDDATAFEFGPAASGIEAAVAEVLAAAGAAAAITAWKSVKSAPYNAVGDGATDDTAAIQAALTAIAATGGRLWFPEGTYVVNAQLNMTLSGTLGEDTVLYGEGVIVANDGHVPAVADMPLDTRMLVITTAGRSLSIEGITFDGSDRARAGMWITENSDSDGELSLDRLKVRNFYGTGGVYVAGVAAFGGFERVQATRCRFENLNRIAVLTGYTFGLAIEHSGAYHPKHVNVSKCLFENITNSDVITDPANIDVDGLHVVGGQAAGATYQTQTATVSDCNFVDCKGRAIKMQRDVATISGCTVRRSISGLVDNFGDINFQGSVGTITNCIFNHVAEAGGESVYAGKGSCIAVYYTGAGRDKAYSISNCHLISNVTSGSLYCFVQASADIPAGNSTKGNSSILIENCTTYGPCDAFVEVRAMQATSHPLQNRVAIRGGSARGLLHGVFRCSSGSLDYNLNSLSVEDFHVYPSVIVPRITGITIHATDPTITTSSNHGLQAGEYVTFRGTDIPALNGVRIAVDTVPSSTTFTIKTATTTAGTKGYVHGRNIIKSTVSSTPTTEAEIVCDASHGLFDGDVVYVEGLSTMTQANNKGFVIDVIDATSFKLLGTKNGGYTGANPDAGTLVSEIKTTFQNSATGSELFAQVSLSRTSGIKRSSGSATSAASEDRLRGATYEYGPYAAGGGVRVYSFVLADDEQANLPQVTSAGSHLFFAISTTYSKDTAGAFLADSSSGVLELPGTTLPSSIVVDSDGTPGTNPDTDTKLNMWFTGGKLYVKNRLGSARTVTITVFGA